MALHEEPTGIPQSVHSASLETQADSSAHQANSKLADILALASAFHQARIAHEGSQGTPYRRSATRERLHALRERMRKDRSFSRITR